MNKKRIKIEGFVEIRNGDTVIKAKNKFVHTILQLILNWLSFTRVSGALNVDSTGPTYSNVFNMYIGTDTVTATVYNTNALTSPIGGAPGTPPNSKGGSVTNPSAGVFQMVITATWNAGTVSGTVGEMALYFALYDAPANLKAYGWIEQYAPTTNALLASRFAVADGAFSPFTINAANPLSIVWTIRLSFA